MSFEPLKIPGLLLATLSLHVAFTPPNPPASEESRQGVSSLGDRILRVMIKIRTLDYVKVRINFNMVMVNLFIDFLGLFLVLCTSGICHHCSEGVSLACRLEYHFRELALWRRRKPNSVHNGGGSRNSPSDCRRRLASVVLS
jgi:hypothetical protein